MTRRLLFLFFLLFLGEGFPFFGKQMGLFRMYGEREGA